MTATIVFPRRHVAAIEFSFNVIEGVKTRLRLRLSDNRRFRIDTLQLHRESNWTGRAFAEMMPTDDWSSYGFSDLCICGCKNGLSQSKYLLFVRNLASHLFSVVISSVRDNRFKTSAFNHCLIKSNVYVVSCCDV